jgi:flagellar basal-body rod modification protein FlgD
MDIPVSSDKFVWAGVSDGGVPFEEGLYTFEVLSIANDEVIGQSQVEIYSKVTEVRSEGGATILVLEGGATVASDQVSALRAPQA